MKTLGSCWQAMVATTTVCIFIAAVFYLPAKASMPVPVKTVEGFIRDGQITITGPQHFASKKPSEIIPCANIPFEPEMFEGKVIQVRAGIDLYNQVLTCPMDVVILGIGPPDKACQFQKPCPEYSVKTAEKPLIPATLQEQMLILKLNTFIFGLEKTVNAHDWKLIMEDYIHQVYLRKQHDRILEKNTAQFLYELFFPGLNKMHDLSICCLNYLLHADLSFKNRINMIQNFEIMYADRNIISYSFTIKNNECRIHNQISLEMQDNGFKLLGAYG